MQGEKTDNLEIWIFFLPEINDDAGKHNTTIYDDAHNITHNHGINENIDHTQRAKLPCGIETAAAIVSVAVYGQITQANCDQKDSRAMRLIAFTWLPLLSDIPKYLRAGNPGLRRWLPAWKNGRH